MSGKHAKYSPSKLPRLIKCAGSVLATEGMQDVSSDYAEEGTMLHEVTEKSIPHGGAISQVLIDQYKLEGGQVNAVNDILNFVVALKMTHTGAYQEFIESHVTLAGYSPVTGCMGLEHVAGTLDYCLVFPQEKTLYVIDWKYGVMEVLPDSPQLKAYALGALDTIGGHDYYYNSVLYNKVVLAIGQPRTFDGDPFKTIETTPIELKDWLDETLVPVINNVENKDTTLNPSKEACQWCLVKNTCKARREMASMTAEAVFACHAKLPHNTDQDEIRSILERAADLRQYLSDIESHVANQIRNGIEFPGYKIVAGRSLRKWEDEKAMLAYTQTLGYSIQDMSISKVMSPAQATKKVGKTVAASFPFQALIIKPEGKSTLVKESDKRQPLEFGNAESKFAEFIGEGNEKSN